MFSLRLGVQHALRTSKSSSCLQIPPRIGARRWLPRTPSNLKPQLPHTGHDRLPSFRDQYLKDNPTFDLPRISDSFRPGIWRQILVFAGGSVVVYHIAAAAASVETEQYTESLRRIWTTAGPYSEDMRRAYSLALTKKLQDGLNSLQNNLSALPKTVAFPFLYVYAQLAEAYINCPDGRRAAYQIIALNTVIWALWQVPRLKPFMNRNFTHNPLSGRSRTLLTSVFSHESFLHLAFNSIALASFGSAAAQYLTRAQAINKDGIQESSPNYHFMAMYITAGMFAALTSHVFSARVLYPRLVSNLASSTAASTVVSSAAQGVSRHASATVTKGTAKNVSKEILPSLGASGAIYALVTTTAFAFPDAQVSLLFAIPVPITWGVGGLVAVDVLGALRGWRVFDHYAHLGGAAFGALYWKFGGDLWNHLRRTYYDETKM